MMLRDECARHVIRNFVILNSRQGESICPLKIPLIARRYFLFIFESSHYSYVLRMPLYHLVVRQQLDVILFNALDVESEHKIKHQTPLIKLLKLAYSMPEVEPGEKGYIGHLDMEAPSLKHSLFVMRELFYNRIPVYHQSSDVLIQEFYDLLSKEFGFHSDMITGKSRALYFLGSNQDDPRVFRSINLWGMNQYAYCPHVFNIKAKDLRIHLDNIALYDTLPPMPHLETMFCHINPIGLYDSSVASSHYEQLAERLVHLAPNLHTMNLKMNCSINSNSLENGEKAFLRALSSLEFAVDGLQKYIPRANPRFFSITLFLPQKARRELPRRVESTVIDEDESLGVDLDDELNHDVCAHFKRLMYWHGDEAGVPNHLDLDNLYFRFFFDDDLYAEGRRDKRIDPQNGYHFWINEF